LKFLNERIEKERLELKDLETMLRIDRAMEDLGNYTKDFKDSLSREKLTILFNDMSEEEINMLYDRLHDIK